MIALWNRHIVQNEFRTCSFISEEGTIARSFVRRGRKYNTVGLSSSSIENQLDNILLMNYISTCMARLSIVLFISAEESDSVRPDGDGHTGCRWTDRRVAHDTYIYGIWRAKPNTSLSWWCLNWVSAVFNFRVSYVMVCLYKSNKVSRKIHTSVYYGVIYKCRHITCTNTYFIKYQTVKTNIDKIHLSIKKNKAAIFSMFEMNLNCNNFLVL